MRGGGEVGLIMNAAARADGWETEASGAESGVGLAADKAVEPGLASFAG
jgi:hypothetical protein